MQNILKLFLVFLLMLILVSCGENSDQTPTLEIPTPGVDVGVVTGRIISSSLGKPPEANLFLSKNITEGRTDIPPVFSFSFQTNPRGFVNEDGLFFFQEVPPGTYAITLWTPPNNAEFIKNSTNDDYIWVVVNPGEVTEMGEVIAP